MIENFTLGMTFGAGAVVGAVIGFALCLGVVSLVSAVLDLLR